MYSILLYCIRVLSDIRFLDVLRCGFGSVSVSIPNPKEALSQTNIAVSRGNYLVTGLIVRRLLARLRGTPVNIPFRLSWRLRSSVRRYLCCVWSCHLDEQFLIVWSHRYRYVCPPWPWCLILYFIHLQFTQSIRSNFKWVKLAKLRYFTPSPLRLILTGSTVNRIHSVIPRSGDRRFHCRIALLFPPQNEDRIQKVVAKNCPGVWSG